MGSEAVHIAACNRTQATLDVLMNDPATHGPWITTLAFYKALHLVEAVFANDHTIRHTSDHGKRLLTLNKTHKYRQIADHFGPLYRASQAARYLTNPAGPDCTTFDEYLSPDRVIPEMIDHYLRKIEQSAVKILKKPELLVSCDRANRPAK